ncbi:hypothetical protein ABR737_10675 [Streptomyces sp. Edi2]
MWTSHGAAHAFHQPSAHDAKTWAADHLTTVLAGQATHAAGD